MHDVAIVAVVTVSQQMILVFVPRVHDTTIRAARCSLAVVDPRKQRALDTKKRSLKNKAKHF